MDSSSLQAKNAIAARATRNGVFRMACFPFLKRGRGSTPAFSSCNAFASAFEEISPKNHYVVSVFWTAWVLVADVCRDVALKVREYLSEFALHAYFITIRNI
jgi:hypothetical protein